MSGVIINEWIQLLFGTDVTLNLCYIAL